MSDPAAERAQELCELAGITRMLREALHQTRLRLQRGNLSRVDAAQIAAAQEIVRHVSCNLSAAYLDATKKISGQ